MAALATAFDQASGGDQIWTAEQMDVTYANLVNCEIEHDFAIIEDDAANPVGYTRTTWADTDDGERAHFFIVCVHPDHLAEPLLRSVIDGNVERIGEVAAAHPAPRHVIRSFARRPLPGEPAKVGVGDWLEAAGFAAVRYAAAMVRPNLDDIPMLALPDGVEIRPTIDDQIRAIWDADHAANHDAWGNVAPTEEAWREFRDDPMLDVSLWRVAWHDDTVVGQVKSFVNHDENAAMGRLRGYAENIATHAAWRSRGIASALLAESLRALRDRGMTEAGLNVDTENPADAMGIYRRLGFEPVNYEAVYDKPLPGVTSG